MIHVFWWTELNANNVLLRCETRLSTRSFIFLLIYYILFFSSQVLLCFACVLSMHGPGYILSRICVKSGPLLVCWKREVASLHTCPYSVQRSPGRQQKIASIASKSFIPTPSAAARCVVLLDVSTLQALFFVLSVVHGSMHVLS